MAVKIPNFGEDFIKQPAAAPPAQKQVRQTPPSKTPAEMTAAVEEELAGQIEEEDRVAEKIREKEEWERKRWDEDVNYMDELSQYYKELPAHEGKGILPGWNSKYTRQGIPDPWKDVPIGNPPGWRSDYKTPGMFGPLSGEPVQRAWKPGEREEARQAPRERIDILMNLIQDHRWRQRQRELGVPPISMKRRNKGYRVPIEGLPTDPRDDVTINEDLVEWMHSPDGPLYEEKKEELEVKETHGDSAQPQKKAGGK